MGGVDGGLADLFHVRRMTKTGERVTVEEFKHLRLPAADAEQQDAIGEAGGEDGRPALQLLAHVVAPVRDRFQPTIGFFSHEIESVKFTTITEQAAN